MNDIEQINVNENWKKVFYNIQKRDGGNLFGKPSEEFLSLEKNERIKINREIYNFGTIIACLFFGPFYYLFKGMWLKTLVYVFVLIIVSMFLTIINVPDFAIRPIGFGLNLFFTLTAPYNFYRLKVLDTQW